MFDNYYLEEAAKIFEIIINRPIDILTKYLCYSKLCTIYWETNEVERSYECLIKTIELFRNPNMNYKDLDLDELFESMKRLIRIGEKKQIDKFIDLITKSYTNDSMENKLSIWINISNCYRECNRFDDELKYLKKIRRKMRKYYNVEFCNEIEERYKEINKVKKRQYDPVKRKEELRIKDLQQ